MPSEFIEKTIAIASLHGCEKTESNLNSTRYNSIPNDEGKIPFGSEKANCEDLIVPIPEEGTPEKSSFEDFEYYEDEESNGSSWNGAISKKRVRRCIKLAIVMILAAFVPKAVSDIYHSSSTTGIKPKTRVMQPFVPVNIIAEPTCKEINIPEDFIASWERSSCMKIVKGYGLVSSLTVDPAAVAAGQVIVTEEIVRKRLSKAIALKSLDIDARINEKWLGLLLTELRELKSVRIRMNGLCEGACVKERNSLPHLELPNVTDLTLHSDSHWCDIITWVFKYKVPELKTLTLKNIKFSRKTFHALVSFLKSDNKQLNSVTLQGCTLCRYGCGLDSVPEDFTDKVFVIN